MNIGQTGNFLHYLRGFFRAPIPADRRGRELVDSFATRRDETAFAALVERHAALVWGICRRILRQAQDAEDAFQATFLVLARKADTVPWRDDIGNWLYAVAVRVARQARARADLRRRRETEASTMPNDQTAPDPALADLKALTDEELGRRPP